MNEMDELLALYRQASRETTAPALDARIVHAAERVARTRRLARQVAWPLALAASVLLWMALHPAAPSGGVAVGEPLTQQLLHMDVAPPTSDVTRFLLQDGVTRPQPRPGSLP